MILIRIVFNPMRSKNDPLGKGPPEDRRLRVACSCGDLLEGSSLRAFRKNCSSNSTFPCPINGCPYSAVVDYLNLTYDPLGLSENVRKNSGEEIIDPLSFMRSKTTQNDPSKWTFTKGKLGIHQLDKVMDRLNQRLPIGHQV